MRKNMRERDATRERNCTRKPPSVRKRAEKFYALSFFLFPAGTHTKREMHIRGNASLGKTWKFVVGARIRSLKNMWTRFSASQPGFSTIPFGGNECSSWAMVTSLTVFYFSPRVALLTKHLSPVTGNSACIKY